MASHRPVIEQCVHEKHSGIVSLGHPKLAVRVVQYKDRIRLSLHTFQQSAMIANKLPRWPCCCVDSHDQFSLHSTTIGQDEKLQCGIRK